MRLQVSLLKAMMSRWLDVTWLLQGSNQRSTLVYYFSKHVVCCIAVFNVVTQSSSPALRDDTKNGCVADHMH